MTAHVLGGGGARLHVLPGPTIVVVSSSANVSRLELMCIVSVCSVLWSCYQPTSTIVILRLITRPHPQEGEGLANYV